MERARLYQLVRDFALTTQPWQTAIRYTVVDGGGWDASAIAEKVYGRRADFMVIQAAAGVESIENPIPAGMLVLPTAQQLRAMKLRAGFAPPRR